MPTYFLLYPQVKFTTLFYRRNGFKNPGKEKQMNKELMDILKQITEEEQMILSGQKEIIQQIYTNRRDFVVDSEKMLEKGKLIDIRTHTRFIRFPRHKHNYIEIIYMCSGQTTHIIDDHDEVVLNKGELLFLNQNCCHEILPAREEDIAVNFIVLPQFFDEAFKMLDDENILRDFIISSLTQKQDTSSYMLFKVSDVLPVQNLVENMVWSLVYGQANKRQIHQTTMGLLLLMLINESDKIQYQENNRYEHQGILQVLRYIESHYRTATLQEIADEMNQSLYQLSKFIKRNTGHTFKELLQTKRLSQAAYLLNTTKLSIADIIYNVGYDNTSYFHRVFKEKYGMTPKDFRKIEK